MGHNKQVEAWSHCLGSNVWPYRLIFCPNVEEKKCIPPNFLGKIILITRIWRKSVFWVWQLSSHNSILQKCCISKTLAILKIYISLVKATFIKKNKKNMRWAFWGMVWAITSKLAPKVTVWVVIYDHISSYFAHM